MKKIIDKAEFGEFHKETEENSFRVTDSKKKTDEEVYTKIRKKYGIENPKEIGMKGKEERNKILGELKKEFFARQLQRITGVSRGVISRIEIGVQ